MLYTAAEMTEAREPAEKSGIAYLGGLGLNREIQLIEIAEAMQSLSEPEVPRTIDVWSGEKDPAIRKIRQYVRDVLATAAEGMRQ